MQLSTINDAVTDLFRFSSKLVLCRSVWRAAMLHRGDPKIKMQKRRNVPFYERSGVWPLACEHIAMLICAFVFCTAFPSQFRMEHRSILCIWYSSIIADCKCCHWFFRLIYCLFARCLFSCAFGVLVAVKRVILTKAHIIFNFDRIKPVTFFLDAKSVSIFSEWHPFPSVSKCHICTKFGCVKRNIL